MKNICFTIILIIIMLAVSSCKKDEFYKYPKDIPQWVKDVIDDPNNNPRFSSLGHTLVQVDEFKNYSDGNLYYYVVKKIETIVIVDYRKIYAVDCRIYSESQLLIYSTVDTVESFPYYPSQGFDFSSYALRRSIPIFYSYF